MAFFTLLVIYERGSPSRDGLPPVGMNEGPALVGTDSSLAFCLPPSWLFMSEGSPSRDGVPSVGVSDGPALMGADSSMESCLPSFPTQGTFDFGLVALERRKGPSALTCPKTSK